MNVQYVNSPFTNISVITIMTELAWVDCLHINAFNGVLPSIEDVPDSPSEMGKYSLLYSMPLKYSQSIPTFCLNSCVIWTNVVTEATVVVYCTIYFLLRAQLCH